MRKHLLRALVLFPAALAAQAPARYERIQAPLFDIVIFADSLYGVQLLASPSLASTTGYRKGTTNRLALLESDIAAWTIPATRLLDSPPLTRSGGAGKYPGVRLSADRGQSALTLGYDPLAASNERYFVLVAEADAPAWRAALPDSAARQLVLALERARARSALADNDSIGPSRAFLTCELDRIPKLKGHPSLRYPRIHPYREGKVWVQFVVDPHGRVDSTTIDVLLSDDPAFEKESRSTLRSLRFSPGEKDGTPVPVLVFQQFSFKVYQ